MVSRAAVAIEQAWDPLARAAGTVHSVVVTAVAVLVADRVTVPVGVPAVVGVAVRVGVKVGVVSCPRAIELGPMVTVVVVVAGAMARKPKVDEAAKLVSLE